MAAGLPELLDARFLFVVGKGGVGKTTTACALALSLADSGRRTHLISTDPAHSVGDLFGLDLAGSGATPSPCSPDLILEELDASARARAWMERVAAPLSELVERGTYLDGDDVQAFVDLVLPGADEVMAALRLVELERGPADRIVVDTAPTGHALRMLDAGRVLAGWIRALEAMAEKAGAVQEAILGRAVQLRGRTVLEELEADLARFESRVLGDGRCLVVSRPDGIVRAETERLLRRLATRGPAPAAELRVGGGGPPSAPGAGGFLEIPLAAAVAGDGPVGCADLRRLGRALLESRTSVAEGRIDPARSAAVGLGVGRRARMPRATSTHREHLGREHFGRELLGRDLLFFAGKGGVGKSTCAAAAALALSDGSEVLLLGTDPAGSLGDLLGDCEEGWVGGSGLRVREVDADAAFTSFRDRYRASVEELFGRLGIDRAAALDRAVVESLLDLAPPGVDEIFALHSLMEAADGGDGRRIVVDAAPTGHFLRLVEMPSTALDWSHAVLRVLLKHRSVLGLDGPAADLLAFARNLRGLMELLQDSRRTGVLIVTLEATVVRSETGRMIGALDRAGIPVLGVLTNRVDGDLSGERTAAEVTAPGLRLRAPLLAEPPVGPGPLRAFFSRWELVG